MLRSFTLLVLSLAITLQVACSAPVDDGGRLHGAGGAGLDGRGLCGNSMPDRASAILRAGLRLH